MIFRAGYIFINYHRPICTMNTIPRYQYLMVFFLIFLGILSINGCYADTIPVIVNDTVIMTPLKSITPVETPTIKPTIAPIHTKEPVVKPPVESTKTGENQAVTLVVTPIPTITIKPVVTVTTTQKNETILETSNNETAETYYQWGRAFQEVGNCEAAVEEYDKAIARDPYYADAWYYRSLCYEKLGMYDEAYESYRFLLTIDPSYFSSGKNTTQSQSGINNSLITAHLIDPNNPFTAGAIFWVIIGAGVGGLFISAILIYHIRKRPKFTVAQVIPRQPSGQVSDSDIDNITEKIREYYNGEWDVFIQTFKLAIEIAREGREGKSIGTAFILGDSDAVLTRSRQLILNPLAGHSETERKISNPDMRENIKELALLDGAFVIREDGTVEAAGRYISIDTSKVKLSKGFGTRHVSVAAITQETKAIGIVVSESGGVVRVMAKGKIILETS
jgi:DNA integrity scanning protein DisA with diadenylate cyclase activity